MDVYSQNVYEIVQKRNKKHILIIYNISQNHYVGISVHSLKAEGLVYIKSINKYADINDLQEYNIKNIKRTSLCKR